MKALWSRWLRHGLALPPLALAPDFGRHFSSGGAGSGPTEPSERPDFASFFDHSSDPMLVLDAGHTILQANAAAARFFGVVHERMRGDSVLEIDLLARLLTAGSILQRRKTDPPPVVDEVSITDPEGQPIQCRIEAIPLAKGRTLIHLQDTTSVLRARSATRSAERLHQTVFESLPEVAWIMALPEERLLEISPAVERVFGYQPAAFRERPELWEELVHPAERERVRAEFRAGIGSGRPFDVQFTGMHRDHRDLPSLVNHVVPIADERGWVDRCQGFIEDQSSQRHLEELIDSTQAYLRTVLDSVPSGVMIVVPAEQGLEIVVCNRRLSDMLRLDEPPRAGTPLSQAPEDLRALARGPNTDAGFERRVLSEEVRDEVAELKNPDRVLRRYAGPVRDAYGGVFGRIIAVEDVTSSWLMHRQLTHSQKMESMGRLAGGVAHDFNNLLGTVLGFGSLLLEETGAEDPRRDALQQIVQAAERASRLTSALLTFSRAARFERLPVQLNRVIEDSYQLLRSTLDPAVAIELRLEPSLPTLLGDTLLLQQVVMNLVQETRDRLVAGGSLYLSTRVADAPNAAGQEGEALQRMVRLEIEISGPPGQKGGAEGLADRAGLALTMAEDIVRAHGGYLLSGPAAAPAVFAIMMPVIAPPETPMIAPVGPVARGHETILVVDDEPGLRLLARTGLKQLGFDVITAESGEQALEMLRSGEPPIDLVLLDLSMPGLSGERVLRAIRGFRPDLPVVIASGYATVESQAAWSAAGAQGFVGKPYRVQDVAQRLREVLDRAHRKVTG